MPTQHTFFFAGEKTDINPDKLQIGPQKKKRLQSNPSATRLRKQPPAPSVARRHSSSPRRLGTGAPQSHREVAERRSLRIYARRSRHRHAESHQHLPQELRQPDPPSREIQRWGRRAPQLRKTAGSTGTADRRRSSKEHLQRDEGLPPTKPHRRRLQHHDAAGWSPHAPLRYIHSANRCSPVLPPPERPAEGEGSADPAPVRWDACRLSKKRLPRETGEGSSPRLRLTSCP
jgi:hypothetical protein